jgi:hypothetical protein
LSDGRHRDEALVLVKMDRLVVTDLDALVP